MALKDDLDAANTSLVTVGTLTDKIAADVTAVAAEVTALLNQIPSAATVQEATDIASAAAQAVGKLNAVATALEAIGPVPTP